MFEVYNRGAKKTLFPARVRPASFAPWRWIATTGVLPPTSPARAFTLIELLIVIAIIALLAAILFPVFSRARENARRSSCASNLKQMALGMMQYVQDYDERFPDYKSSYIVSDTQQITPSCSAAPSATPTTCVRLSWADLLEPYIKSAQIFNDPSDGNQYFDGCTFLAGSSSVGGAGKTCVAQYGSSLKVPYQYLGATESTVGTDGKYRSGREGLYYGYDARISNSGLSPRSLSEFEYPSEKLMLAEAAYYRIDLPNAMSGYCGHLSARHFDGVNVAFADGHVKWMKWGFVCQSEDTNQATQRLWFVNGVDN